MPDRKKFLALCTSLGLGATLLPGVVWAFAEQKGPVTAAMIDEAAAIADVTITDDQKAAMLDNLTGYRQGYDAIYALKMPNGAAPALNFDPVPHGMKLKTKRAPMTLSALPKDRSPDDGNYTVTEDLAFLSV